jgi:hypothetical protein
LIIGSLHRSDKSRTGDACHEYSDTESDVKKILELAGSKFIEISAAFLFMPYALRQKEKRLDFLVSSKCEFGMNLPYLIHVFFIFD